MSGLVMPQSPKHGYEFDGHEHDVRKVRKARRCEGGHTMRGGGPGAYSPDCTGTIQVGDIACATIIDLFGGDNYACVPCALGVRAIEAVRS